MHFTTSAALLLLASYVSAAPVIVTQIVTQVVHVPAGSQPTQVTKAVTKEINAAGLSVPSGPTTTTTPAFTTTTSVPVYADPAPAPAASSSVPSNGNGNGNGNGSNDGYTDPGAGETGPTVKFRTLDNKSRTILFVANPGFANLTEITVHPGKDYPYTFPNGWQGNYQAIAAGTTFKKPGMLGEVTCNGYGGAHYFDVSAEKNEREDWDGVKQLFPEKAQYPMSGCNTWPCDNVYICWNDNQTKATKENTFIQTLGNGKGYDMTDAAYAAKDVQKPQQCDFRSFKWNAWFGLTA